MRRLQPEVLEQISSWPSAHAHGDELCTQLIAYTDGSACMTRARPRLAAEAGWRSVTIAVDASGVWKLAGGVWGPVETDPAAQLFFGASRPTCPVADHRHCERAEDATCGSCLHPVDHSLGFEVHVRGCFGRRSRPFGDTSGPAGAERSTMLQATCCY